ncbi:multicopper oxidase domain-containing protein [Proteiniclasticum sp. BAD-10]|uniref:Multicopper oxidase domain-containing protein n=1 Tax=Proteiniclasticum sediminis TaxID=2804028 RepID=A0A941HPB6_9CLOT|nr:multicopper oxidase domain-containing protein [Proteiniclasticum sediminis]MBR0575159.1 multicopper oxidase domain-containing protein [Proteiniclasticum sediminis]
MKTIMNPWRHRHQIMAGLCLVLSGILFSSCSLLPSNGGRPGDGVVSSERNPLRIPELLEDRNPDPNMAEYALEAREGEQEFIPGKLTKTFGYNGDYLGPVLRMRRGEQVSIQVSNALTDDTTIHWHGLEVDGEQDGGPHQKIKPGDTWNPQFTVDQPAATLWFHPHLAGTTANQVYMGLAGLIYIEDEVSDGLNLPKEYGVNDLPVIVQDRNFKADGSFAYEVSMMGVVPGNHLLINGTENPYVEVNQGKVRLRLLNASNADNYTFTLSDNLDFQQIASDGGFLEKSVVRKAIELSPGERAEVVVDLSAVKEDKTYLLVEGYPGLEFRILQLGKDTTEVPSQLVVLPKADATLSTGERSFQLEGMGIQGTINGKVYDPDRMDETIPQGKTEIWTLTTTFGGMMQSGGHPFHVHGTQFRVLSRNGKEPPEEERGYKDTVFVGVGEEVRILIQFKHQGMYMYHCHILEHEDYGMMGQIMVTAP